MHIFCDILFVFLERERECRHKPAGGSGGAEAEGESPKQTPH